MKKQKPWMDKNGKALSTRALKKVSRNWDQETWTAYLDSCENHAFEENECNVSDLSMIDDLRLEALAEYLPNSDQLSDELLDDVKEAIEQLPKRERFVMEEQIYLEKSQRSIASEINVSRRMVRNIRKKSLATLAPKLAKHRSF
jgi:RNA polymerase sigma factor (sigma-70 family)